MVKCLWFIAAAQYRWASWIRVDLWTNLKQLASISVRSALLLKHDDGWWILVQNALCAFINNQLTTTVELQLLEKRCT
jgi:hypothetical protein